MTTEIQTAWNGGSSRLVYVLHVCGMPWAVATDDTSLSLPTSATTLRRKIFGNGLHSDGATYLADTLQVYPWLADIGACDMQARETEADLQGGDWSCEIIDGQPGASWVHNATRSIYGLEGLGVAIDERADTLIHWWELGSPVTNASTVISLTNGSISLADWATLRGAGCKMIWVGQECMTIDSVGNIISRGVYKTRVQSAWPGSYNPSGGGGSIVADAPLGGVVGRPVHLWALLVKADGTVEGEPVLWRHGKVSGRSDTNGGKVSLQILPWISWLDTKPRGVSPRLSLRGHMAERWDCGRDSDDIVGTPSYATWKSGGGYSEMGLYDIKRHPHNLCMQVIELARDFDALDESLIQAYWIAPKMNVAIYDPIVRLRGGQLTYSPTSPWPEIVSGIHLENYEYATLQADVAAWLNEMTAAGYLKNRYVMTDHGPEVARDGPHGGWAGSYDVTVIPTPSFIKSAPLAWCSGPLAWLMGWGYADERWLTRPRASGAQGFHYDAWLYYKSAQIGWEWGINAFGTTGLRPILDHPAVSGINGVVNSNLRPIPGPSYNGHMYWWTGDCIVSLDANNNPQLRRGHARTIADDLEPWGKNEIDPYNAWWGEKYRAAWSLAKQECHASIIYPLGNTARWYLPSFDTELGDVGTVNCVCGVVVDGPIYTLDGQNCTIGSEDTFFNVDQSLTTLGSLGNASTQLSIETGTILTPEYEDDERNYRNYILKTKDLDGGSASWPSWATHLAYFPGVTEAGADTLAVTAGGKLTGSYLVSWLKSALGDPDYVGTQWAIPEWLTTDIVPDALEDTDTVCTGDTPIESIDWQGLGAIGSSFPGWHRLQYETGTTDTLRSLLKEVLKVLGYRVGWEYSAPKRCWHLTFSKAGAVNASLALISGTAINPANLLVGAATKTTPSSGPICTAMEFKANYDQREAKLKVTVTDSSGYAAAGGRSSVLSAKSKLSRVPNATSTLTAQLVHDHCQGVLSSFRSPRASMSCRLTIDQLLRTGVGSLVTVTDVSVRDPFTGTPTVTGRYGLITRQRDNTFERQPSVDVEISLASQAAYGWAPSLYCAPGDSTVLGNDSVRLDAVANDRYTRTAFGKDLWFFDCYSWQPGDAAPTARTCTCTDYAVDVFEVGDTGSSTGADCYEGATISIDISTGKATLSLVGIGLTWDTNTAHVVTYSSWDNASLQPCQRPWLYGADTNGQLVDSAAAITPARRWV